VLASAKSQRKRSGQAAKRTSGRGVLSAALTVLIVVAWRPTPALSAEVPAANASPGGSSSEAAAAGPNVVMIIGDDQAWGDFGFMGHPAIHTPHLDRLASQSLVFTRGYVPSSLCRPSLATLATGLYPHQHRITSNDPPGRPDRALMLRNRQRQIANIERVPTLARLLGQRGYVSFQTGKWWEGNFSRGGFTEGMTHGDPARGGRHGDAGLKIGREGLEPIFDFLDRHQGRPFFIWYAPFLPHQPHNPPEELLAHYREKTDSIHVARYWAMCEWFDQTCGELLAGLERRGLADNTLVVFVVDNGWIQQPDAARYAPRSKRSPNEGGIRTPIMLRWPGHIQARRDESTPVVSVDLVPTILGACGLEPTAEMPGVNLLDTERLAKREAIFGEIFTHDAVKVDDPASSLQYRWCIEGRWKLILPNPKLLPDAQPELYDLEADPREDDDLAARRPQVVERLHTRIEQWWPLEHTSAGPAAGCKPTGAFTRLKSAGRKNQQADLSHADHSGGALGTQTCAGADQSGGVNTPGGGGSAPGSVDESNVPGALGAASGRAIGRSSTR